MEQLPKYRSSNYNKKEVARDGDCGYHSLIHGLVIIKEKNPTFDLQFLEGVVKNKNKTVSYDPDWIDMIKMYIEKDRDHWLDEDDFREITNLWDICIATYDRTQKTWKYFKPDKVWTTLSGLNGCKNLIIFHHELTGDICNMDDYGTGVTGGGDHWSLLIPKFTWDPYKITDLDERIHYTSEVYKKFRALRKKVGESKYKEVLLKIKSSLGLVIPEEVDTPTSGEQQRRDFEMFFEGEFDDISRSKPSPPKSQSLAERGGGCICAEACVVGGVPEVEDPVGERWIPDGPWSDERFYD